MTKSIYDDVLEKIDVEFDAWERAEHLELFKLVEQVVEQAQKQEKLLGHYKDLAEGRKELYNLTINFKPSNKDRMIVLFMQENLISDIIKELENKDYKELR